MGRVPDLQWDVYYGYHLVLKDWLGSLHLLVSILHRTVSLYPAMQPLSKIGVVGHQFIHVHDLGICLGVALYLVRHWSDFG